MKLLIQRVREAAVAVDGETIGQIGHGLLVFVGVADTDTKQIADKLVDKMTKLRIFDDAQGKTNLAAADVQGEFLIVSQFTLYADCRKGNRPSFTDAAIPSLQMSCMSISLILLRQRASIQNMAALGQI